MDRTLRFKHHLRPEPFADERVLLVAERERFLLRGRVEALVAPLVDGRRGVDEIVAALEGRVPAPEVHYTLMRLLHAGYLVDEPPSPAPEVAGFWESLGVNAGDASERLGGASIAVHAVGGEDPRPLAAALESAGIAVRERGLVSVVVTADYLDPELDAWSRDLGREARWAPIKAAGIEGWIGPMLGAAGSSCWACLAARLRDHRPLDAYLQRQPGGGAHVAPPRAVLPAQRQAVLHLAAVALARWIAGGGHGVLDDHLLRLDADSLGADRHRVVRRPQCPACGDPGTLAGSSRAPIVLEARPKRFTADGGHRTVTPEETLARFQHHISPITGVVIEVRAVGGDDPRRQVYSAVVPVCPTSPEPSFADFYLGAGGKGRSPAQARTGALCEALERHSAVYRDGDHHVRARRSELGEEAVHPHALAHFSEAQYRARGAGGDARRAVPRPYDDEPIAWVPVWSLTYARRRFVPLSAVYLHAPIPPEEQFCPFNSNGNAAGNCLEEAILQGFFELVERDAVAIWWYNRLRRPGVDLASFGVPYFSEVEAYYRARQTRLWALDLTHDLAIPAFVAIALAADSGAIWAGCGCHFDARLALQRALTEVGQCFDPRPGARPSSTVGALGDASYLFPDESAAPPAPSVPRVEHDDLRDDVLAGVARAGEAGLETLVLDQTRPDVGLSAVKVIVPGLRHFWPRFGAGRLYDVPVRLGWRDGPLDEAALNPVPFLY